MARSEAPRRLTFNKNADFVVRRAFKHAGRPYAVGQPFKFALSSMTEKQARLLYGSGHIVEASGTATVQGVATGTGDSQSSAMSMPEETKAERLAALGKLSLKELQAMAENRGVDKKMSKTAQIKALTE